MKNRVLAVLVGTGVAVGGGAAAWAETGRPGGRNREVAKACRAEAREHHAEADKATLRDAVKACLEDAGIKPRQGSPLTPEQRAKRDALRSCLREVKSANPDADKARLRQLARHCFEQAGVVPGRVRARMAAARECLAEVRASHPGLDKAALRPLVKECVDRK